jgi:hypothetical protein
MFLLRGLPYKSLWISPRYAPFYPPHINGLIHAFKFIKMDCSLSLQDLPFPNTLAQWEDSLSPSSTFPPIASCSLLPTSPPRSPYSQSFDGPSVDSSEEREIFFQLRSRFVLAPLVSGSEIGTNPDSHKSKKGCGHISHFSKDQNRDLLNIASRRQWSILGDLRVVNAPDGVPP